MNMNYSARRIIYFAVMIPLTVSAALKGTGDLGIVIERTAGRVMLVDTTRHINISEFEGLGDLSHASAVFSRDARYAYVFGRDGGLTKLDLLTGAINKRIIQAGNSIGGAISQDGKYVATSNYDPGGIKIFSAETLELIADIPASYGEEEKQQLSKVVGLVDAPGQLFIASLYDAGEIWVINIHDPEQPVIQKFHGVGLQPYDALITPGGRYYIAGLYGENGLAVLDLWHPDRGVTRILNQYGRGEKQLPVYKMPHLEGWAMAGNYLFVPAIGHHAVHVIDINNWQEVTQIKTRGQPVFAIARPDGRQVWVNYALPDNSYVEVIDVAKMEIIKQLQPGKAVLHMEFTPRGEEVWISVRDDDRVSIYDTDTFNNVAVIEAEKPSGIFFTARAHKIGL
jgi:protein NirF